ncbi:MULTISPECIES: hypothetical protein [unclassified Streptomyces]|uniref:hypothetical protein n=1 Tax=unclassified Streptomyces TaxID=2593676 RepID=UPI00296644D7|nr:hypothetical protein [Streptomyces sp. SJL17-1]
MPHPVSDQLAERIESLFGHSRDDLDAHNATTDRPTMLAALLDGLATIEQAEKNIEFQRERLVELAAPGRDIGPAAAGHLLDCSRRIAESVATRDAQTRFAAAVIQSLYRPLAPAATPVAQTPTLTASTVRTR